MDAPNIAVPETPPPARRRWRRVLRAGLWSGLGLMLGTAGIYLARLPLANYVLRQGLPDLPATVGALAWENGALVLRKVTLGARTDGQPPLLAVERLQLPFNKGKNLGRVVIHRPVLHLDPQGLASLEKQFSSAPGAATASTPFSLAGLEITEADLNYTAGNGQQFQATLNWQGDGISQQAGGSLAVARQRVELTPQLGTLPPLLAEWSVDPIKRSLIIHELRTSRPGRIVLDEAVLALLDASPSKEPSPFQGVEIQSASVQDLQVDFPKCPGLEQPLLATLSLTAEPDGTAHAVVNHILLANKFALPKISGRLRHGNFAERRWELQELAMEPLELPTALEVAAILGHEIKMPFAVQGQIAARVPQLLLTANGAEFPAPAELTVKHAVLALPLAAQPFATWNSLTVSADPLTVMQTGRVEKILWEQPDLHWSNAVLSAFPSNSKTEPVSPSEPIIWRAADLQIQQGKLALENWGVGFPNIAAQVDVLTGPLQSGGEAFYQLKLTQPQVARPGEPPIYQGKEVFAALHPERIWTRKSLEQVYFRESRVDIGATAADAELLTLPSTLAPAIPHELAHVSPGQEPGEAEALDLPEGWHIRSLRLQNTRIHLHRLIPDLPVIELPISYKTLSNVPLEPEQLARHEEPLRLELPLVHLPGTRAGTSVADLDTNFIHFRLAGLMQQQIDRVQLVNPKIYVGDSLFHYIDKLRTEAASPDPLQASVAQIALAIFSQLGGETAAPARPGWSIAKLQAVNGKLITTVKDSPLLRVPPLPFGAESSLQDSEINAELAIPPGLYKPILGLDLVAALKGGSIKFNLPKKQQTNNLVQVFAADWIRYKQLRFSDVKLSVTYDEFGIYAKFWAQAYGGYLEGAFNLYLTDQLSWDGWLSLTDVAAQELTSILTPAYFTMDGKLTGVLVAQGDRQALYQATGNLKGSQSGKMKILALEDVIKSIPEDWDTNRRALTIQALETVRDFRYTAFKADLRFYGIEGNINLNLSGPDGQRNIEIHSHDRRIRIEAE